MKKAFVLLSVFIVALALVIPVSAETPGPGGPFLTAFRVQNIDTASAQCSYTLYSTAGASSFSSSVTTVAAGDSLYVYTGDATFSSLAQGSYSAVVSCDKQVAAVSNYSDANSGASYSGVTTPATTWYAPSIYDNYYGFDSNVYVQNATGAAINATVEIYKAGTAAPVVTLSQSIPAYAAYAFDQKNNATLEDNVAYSAKISGTGNIAPVVNISDRSGIQLYSYNPFSAGATKFYVPVVMNAYYGNNTAITIQNLGSVSTPVTITYGTGQSQSVTIGSLASEVILNFGTTPVPAGSLTGATIQSGGQPIIATVNMSNDYNRAATYSGFASGTTTVSLPIVMKRYYGYNTAVTCENVGTAAATMSITYSGVTGAKASASVAVGATTLFYQPDASQGLADGYIGSATVTSAQAIVCVVNEDMNEGAEGSTSWDMQYSYNGINK